MTKPKSHDRAPGQTAISVSLSVELRDKIKAAAEADDRMVSNWISRTLKTHFEELEKKDRKKES